MDPWLVETHQDAADKVTAITGEFWTEAWSGDPRSGILHTGSSRAAGKHVTIGHVTVVILTPDSPGHAFQRYPPSCSVSKCLVTGSQHPITTPVLLQHPQAVLPKSWHEADLFEKNNRIPQSEIQNKKKFQQQETCDTRVEVPSDVQLADIYNVDSITGWPIKRSESLESRDNPFVPGGELSRETENILSRATIVRELFYFNEGAQQSLAEQQQQPEQQQQKQQQLQQQQLQQQKLQQQKLQQQQKLTGFQTPDSQDFPVHSGTTQRYCPFFHEASVVVEKNCALQSSSSPFLATASPNGCQRQCHEHVTQSRYFDDKQPAQRVSEDVRVCEDLQAGHSNRKQRNKCCCMM